MNVWKMDLADFPVTELSQFCGPSFFASAAFANLWTTKGGRPVVWCLMESNTTLAILPGVEFGHSFLKRFMSMPDGCYGGVFFHPHHQAQRTEHAAALLKAVLGDRYLRTFIFDFDGDLEPTPEFEVMNLATTLVDISNPDWLPPDKKLLSQIRKAEREGIEVGPMQWARHGDRFMELMALTEKRHHRRPAYPRAFFTRLAKVAEQEPRLHWVWCEFQGQAVCSHIYIIERNMLQGWQIYFDKEFSFLKPNQYIRFTTCREMATKGIGWLNLGGTPENAPGLCYYKKRWGGETFPYRGLVHRRHLGRWL